MIWTKPPWLCAMLIFRGETKETLATVSIDPLKTDIIFPPEKSWWGQMIQSLFRGHSFSVGHPCSKFSRQLLEFKQRNWLPTLPRWTSEPRPPKALAMIQPQIAHSSKMRQFKWRSQKKKSPPPKFVWRKLTKKNLPKKPTKRCHNFPCSFFKEKSHVSWFSYGNQHLGKSRWPRGPRGPNHPRACRWCTSRAPFSCSFAVSFKAGELVREGCARTCSIYISF